MQDLNDAALFEQSATLQVAVIGNDPAPEFGDHPPPYEEQILLLVVFNLIRLLIV